MAAAGIKFDTGSGAFVSNCFPVRPIAKYGEPGEGAWLEAHRAEQRKNFKAIVCAKPPRTYSRIKQERLAAERVADEAQGEKAEQIIDGFFLLKHSCVEDPSDLCALNISGLNCEKSNPDDFQLFDNVAYINAAENTLPLEIFDKFPIIRELELPVNQAGGFSLSHKMFKSLEMLDLSYNSLNLEDILQLGYLRNLKVLYLSGNNLHALPENMAGFYVTKSGSKKRRFPKLEILCLDDNQLSMLTAFAPLAGLKQLKHLNLERNVITAVPQMEPKSIKHDQVENDENWKTDDEAESAEEEEQKEERNDFMEFQFEELKVPDMTDIDGTKVVEGQGTNTFGDGEVVTDSEDELDDDNEPNLPFPQLRFLTLAHNLITEEEDLLPLAAWPNINQVYIYDNPLTSNKSGDPPMLKKFLTERLGIQLIRKKPVKEAPSKLIAIPKERKVRSHVPAIPKCNVEQLLMIESSKRQQTVNSSVKSPLPPIAGTAPPAEEPESASSPQQYHPASHQPPLDQEPESASSPQQYHPASHQPPLDQEAETFFMTQVDDQAPGLSFADTSEVRNLSHQSIKQEARVVIEKEEKPKKMFKLADEAQMTIFRGYEELLIVDDEEKHIKVSADVSSTVKALQYALKHPVVNNHTLKLDTEQKPFLPYQRTDTYVSKRPQTKAEKVNTALESVKRMSTVIEAPLEKALTDKDLQKKYPEATKLLRDIQRKYANVRSNTYSDARSIQSRVLQSMMATTRAHTEMLHMADKTTSMTQLIENKPSDD